MNQDQPTGDKQTRPVWQFTVRGLILLTLLIAVVLSIARAAPQYIAWAIVWSLALTDWYLGGAISNWKPRFGTVGNAIVAVLARCFAMLATAIILGIACGVATLFLLQLQFPTVLLCAKIGAFIGVGVGAICPRFWTYFPLP